VETVASLVQEMIMKGQNPKLLGSQTLQLYSIFNFKSFCDVQISLVAQSSKSHLWTQETFAASSFWI
jgi:hypothetical protein